jgi:hypothetical protein
MSKMTDDVNYCEACDTYYVSRCRCEPAGSKTHYVIAPLEWSGRDNERGVFKTASTPFGSYTLKCDPGGHNCEWGYCFNEYYDENSFPVDSLQGGMDAAWADWVDRLTGALIKETVTNDHEPVPGNP